jgi:hypothetical protein
MDIAMYGIKQVFFRDFYEKGEKSFEIAHKFDIKMVQI